MKIGCIGDVHGHWKEYDHVMRRLRADGCDMTIQLGDMGVGFGPKFKTYDDLVNTHNQFRDYATDKLPPGSTPEDTFGNPLSVWVRGNHDNPVVCNSFPSYMKDGSCRMIGDKKFMFVGGGISIDKEWRTSGWDYWPEEDLSYSELSTIIDIYRFYQPDVMITHDCPTNIAFDNLFKGKLLEKRSRTSDAFQAMFEYHKPEKWFFGHFHMHRKETIEGCEFVCLEELQTMTFEV